MKASENLYTNVTVESEHENYDCALDARRYDHIFKS